MLEAFLCDFSALMDSIRSIRLLERKRKLGLSIARVMVILPKVLRLQLLLCEIADVLLLLWDIEDVRKRGGGKEAVYRQSLSMASYPVPKP
jgi:hypothetical protein